MSAPTGGVDDATAHYVKSQKFGAQAWGELEWVRVNTAWRGRVGVFGVVDLSVTLEFNFRPLRPHEPTVVLLVDNRGVWRIDHNQSHRREVSTHLQRAERDDFVRLDPIELGSPPLDSDVEFKHMARAFRGSAKYLNIDITGFKWTDPPEEV